MFKLLIIYLFKRYVPMRLLVNRVDISCLVRRFAQVCVLCAILGVADAWGQSAEGEQKPSFIGCRVDNANKADVDAAWVETPMLRKRFSIERDDINNITPTTRYEVNVTSLGYHELFINGSRVGDSYMQPAVSQLNKRALRVTYDISDAIHEGDNELLLWIGQGWGRIYGTPAAVQASILKVEVDGKVVIASSDTTWEASPSGYSYTGSWQPLQFGGERFDARVKPSWRPASLYNADGIEISQQEFVGNKYIDYLQPVEVVNKNDYILLDFGRVVTGWFMADFLPMEAGHEVRMEYLDDYPIENGVANPEPYSEADIYVADGTDDAHFTNRFMMHAFRYVKVTGLSDYWNGTDCETVDCLPAINAWAIQISAVNPRNGATFSCSDKRLNAIHDMIKNTLSCLTFNGYMVDCPHLERMGYGGDGNASTMTLQTMWDVRDTYRNWLTAWNDAMEEDGELPYVAPAFRTGGGPYWCSFIIKAPWSTYLNYGDSTLLLRHYQQMKQWLQYVEDHSTDGILQPWPDNDRHSWFLGDWLAPDGVDIRGESVLHVNSCLVSECLGYMEQIATLLNYADDARLFAKRRDIVNTAIHQHFYHAENHTYANGTPLDQAYALLMDVPPDTNIRKAVEERLLEDCHVRWHDHIAVGLVGVPVFTEWCIRERQSELMATILRQVDYPGYLYMIEHGATSTWESWNGVRSRVHNCYNGIGLWFYQALAGIRPDKSHPGYSHFFFDPQPVTSIDSLYATQPTPHGTIAVEITPDAYILTVPEGSTATVLVADSKIVGPGTWRFPKK